MFPCYLGQTFSSANIILQVWLASLDQWGILGSMKLDEPLVSTVYLKSAKQAR